jgi:class 3 adenylate cyclase
MEFRLLGPLEARDGDRPVALGGAVDRAAEIGALASTGELLVSSVVAELAAGSDLRLEPREVRLPGGEVVRLLAHTARR